MNKEEFILTLKESLKSGDIIIEINNREVLNANHDVDIETTITIVIGDERYHFTSKKHK